MKLVATALMFCVAMAMFAGFVHEEYRYDVIESDRAEFLAYNFATCRARFTRGDVLRDILDSGNIISDYAGACTAHDTSVKVYYQEDTHELTVWIVDSTDAVSSTANVLNALNSLAAAGRLVVPQGTRIIQDEEIINERQHIPARSLVAHYNGVIYDSNYHE